MTKLRDILNETNYGKQKLNELSDEAYLAIIKAAQGRGAKQGGNLKRLAQALMSEKGKRKYQEEAIKTWLKAHRIENYTIKSDGTVDVNGNVQIYSYGSDKIIPKLPVKFGKVSGDFEIHSVGLTTLENCPESVGRSFVVGYNKLTSLKGAPTKVGLNFACMGNKLTSLEGAPKEVPQDFGCSDNKLTTLKGAPTKVGRAFHCDENQLTSLKGGPQIVGDLYTCHDNQLTTLEGAPKTVRRFWCWNNKKQFTEEDVLNVTKISDPKMYGAIATTKL